MKKAIGYDIGSGNVFKDLGLENAEELAIRAEMILTINRIIKARSLKQTDVAELVGLSQGDVSMLTNGTVRRFSTDRIMQVLSRLGRDIETSLSRPRNAGRRDASP
jgi:predicted XRE-type DNA-binding protein